MLYVSPEARMITGRIMKRYTPVYLLLFLNYFFGFLLLILFPSCEKEEITPLFVSTSIIKEVSTTWAKCGGYVEGGEAESYGVCWSSDKAPTIENDKTMDGSGYGLFNSYIDGLDLATVYYVRAYAIKNGKVTYGNEKSLTTLGGMPIAITEKPLEVHETSAKLMAMVNANYLDTEVFFEYGLNENYGEIVQGSLHKVIGNTDKIITASISNLEELSTYHYRVVAKNTVGEVYGENMVFTLSGTKGTIVDIDDNMYETIAIGRHVWMSENLNVTHLNDGTPIRHIDDPDLWPKQSHPSLCYFHNDSANYYSLFGTYYNWHTINTGKVCPVGWHVPDENEWQDLQDYLDEDYAGGKMKTTGYTYWARPNTGATNTSGFNGRGGGLRYNQGHWSGPGHSGIWWTSTLARYALIEYDNDDLRILGGLTNMGLNIRCVKD